MLIKTLKGRYCYFFLLKTEQIQQSVQSHQLINYCDIIWVHAVISRVYASITLNYLASISNRNANFLEFYSSYLKIDIIQVYKSLL